MEGEKELFCWFIVKEEKEKSILSWSNFSNNNENNFEPIALEFLTFSEKKTLYNF